MFVDLYCIQYSVHFFCSFLFFFECRDEHVSLVPQALGMNNSELSDHLVVFFGDERYGSKHGKYRMNRLFWECYGNKWGVLTRFLNPKDFTGCQHHTDWYMSRVCAMAVLVESLGRNVTASLRSLDLDLKGVRWIIHLDMDTIPTNLALPLSAFTNAWGDHDLVFYERFHNGEITGGNYAVRVSETAANFLRGWESQVGVKFALQVLNQITHNFLNKIPKR